MPLLLPRMQSAQQPLQVRFLKDDFKFVSDRQGGRVTTGSYVLFDAVLVQEHKLVHKLPPGWVSFQTAACFLDDGNGIAAGSWFDVQM